MGGALRFYCENCGSRVVADEAPAACEACGEGPFAPVPPDASCPACGAAYYRDDNPRTCAQCGKALCRPPRKKKPSPCPPRKKSPPAGAPSSPPPPPRGGGKKEEGGCLTTIVVLAVFALIGWGAWALLANYVWPVLRWMFRHWIVSLVVIGLVCNAVRKD